jgi:hypothetical protein
LHRDAHAIVAALPESAGQAHRGLDVFDRVADDGKQSCCAIELVEHVNSRPSCRSPAAKAIDGSANVIIAAINNVLHHQASG